MPSPCPLGSRPARAQIARLEKAGHELPLSVWADLLLALQPEQYADLACAEQPTKALPGSPEKISVLRRRRQQRRALWHPADPTDEQAPVPKAQRARSTREVRGVTRVTWRRAERWRARVWLPAERRYRHLGLHETWVKAVGAVLAFQRAARVAAPKPPG